MCALRTYWVWNRIAKTSSGVRAKKRLWRRGVHDKHANQIISYHINWRNRDLSTCTPKTAEEEEKKQRTIEQMKKSVEHNKRSKNQKLAEIKWKPDIHKISLPVSFAENLFIILNAMSIDVHTWQPSAPQSNGIESHRRLFAKLMMEQTRELSTNKAKQTIAN